MIRRLWRQFGQIRNRRVPAEDRLPVPFIVGASRSGTTMLRLMLDAHPELAIPPETHFVPLVASECASAVDARAKFVETLSSYPRWSDHHLDAGVLAQRVAAIEPFDVGEGLRTFYTLYVEKMGKPRWGDKTPHYQLCMLLIQQLLPEAHFIHMIRDGRDLALSIKDLWFGPNSIEEAAHWWVDRIGTSRCQAQQLKNYLEVRYEDLVLETEPTLRRVCSFIQLPFDSRMLTYYERAEERINEMDRAVPTADGSKIVSVEERRGIHSLTSQPPRADRIGRWRREMSAADLALFEAIAGDLLEELGYQIGQRG